MTPRRVAVVGAGMAGRPAARFPHGAPPAVTVLQRGDVWACSSWRNAGWMAPAIATPLPEPAVLRDCLPGGRPTART